MLNASAFNGQVQLEGKEGNDTLLGGSNNDFLSGDGGFLNGGNGFRDDDFLDRGAGDDFLSGETGNDTLIGGLGNDRLNGGIGNDTYSIRTGDAGDSITEDANTGIDIVESEISFTLAANVENLTLLGASNIDSTGNGLNNTLTGNDANNTLTGGEGNDTLVGGNESGEFGFDTLLGGGGNDLLVGGFGFDDLTGGAGANRFCFNAFNEGNDVITDFFAAADSIEVKASGFGGGLKAGSAISADQLVLGSAAGDANDRFIYESNAFDGALFFDKDGTGSASRVLLAGLPGVLMISAADIVVI